MVERRTPDLGIAQPIFDQAPVPMPAPNYWDGNNFVLGGARAPQGMGGRFGRMRPGQLRSGLLGGGVNSQQLQHLYQMLQANGIPMNGLLGSPTPTKVEPLKGLLGRFR